MVWKVRGWGNGSSAVKVMSRRMGSEMGVWRCLTIILSISIFAMVLKMNYRMRVGVLALI